MNFLEFLKHTGHEVKVVAEHVEKPALKVVQIAGEVAAIAAPIALPEALPFSLSVSRVVSGIFQQSIQGDKMNPLESFAITMILGIIQSTVKNPAHKAALKSQLVGIADLIYTDYGMAAPTAAEPVGE
jgi:hypothetical protein